MNVRTAHEGRVGSEEIEGWEHMNEVDEVNSNPSIAKTMNRMKLKRQPMSTFIMKDLLGGDADAEVKNIKKQHDKVLNHDRRKVNKVY